MTGDVLLSNSDKILGWGAATISVGAITWAAWTTMEMSKRPTSQDVVNMIQVHSPYAQDRGLLLQRMEDDAEFRQEMKMQMTALTRAVTALEVQIQSISRGGGFGEK